MWSAGSNASVPASVPAVAQTVADGPRLARAEGLVTTPDPDGDPGNACHSGEQRSVMPVLAAMAVTVLGLWTSECAIASDSGVGVSVSGNGSGDLLAAAWEAGKAMDRLRIAYERRAQMAPSARTAVGDVLPAQSVGPASVSNPNVGRASPHDAGLSRIQAVGVQAGEECIDAIGRAAAGLGIPAALALALGEVESSNWPWAVNAALTGKRFKTRYEAVRYVAKERRQGVATIDVGCLQVSLYWHADAFSTLEEAFDPDANVRAGLARLGDLKRQTGSWTEAVALYHGGDAAERERYTCAVLMALRRQDGGRQDGGRQYGGRGAGEGTGTVSCRQADVLVGGFRDGERQETAIATLGPDERTQAMLKEVQRRLRSLGYDAGPADAKIGPLTASALSAFQASRGLPQSGRVTPETVAELGIDQAFEIASDELRPEDPAGGDRAGRTSPNAVRAEGKGK